MGHFLYFFLFFFLCFYFYFWLCWVSVSARGPSLVAVSGCHPSSRCAGLSLSRPLLLRSTGSRRAGSVVVAHGPSCSAACGIFPDQGSNPCPLHWQADSQPLRHQGSPAIFLIERLGGMYKYSKLLLAVEKFYSSLNYYLAFENHYYLAPLERWIIYLIWTSTFLPRGSSFTSLCLRRLEISGFF